MGSPSFPTEFVTDKVRQLGYGTGPWSRDVLAQRWNETTADKFIRDAKEAGWLVSPQRGTYYIPAAADLMVVSWLPPNLRQEYLIAQTLATSGTRFWCLSAWCRDRGLDLGGPVFVTDLSRNGASTVAAPGSTTADRRAKARQRAAGRSNISCLDEVLIVPEMPALTPQPVAKRALMPVSAEAQRQRQLEAAVVTGAVGLFALGYWAFTKERPPGLEIMDKVMESDERARAIPYTVGPGITDAAWVVALLAALGIARADEVALRLVKEQPNMDMTALSFHLAAIGPPQPNTDWSNAIATGPFPYLLVPPLLWQQMGADQAARRARTLDKLGVPLGV